MRTIGCDFSGPMGQRPTSTQLTHQCRAIEPRRGAIAVAVSLILAAAAAHAQEAPTAESEAGDSGGLQEVTVTAQRRAQSAQDIPYNISVISGRQLGSPSVNNASDLAKIVPGLLTVDSGPAARGNTNSFAMRGIRTDNPGSVDFPGQTVSPVSTYFGETPVFIPLVLRDLDHVEVLRGPQATLYGSGAEAGTIRFIPNRPTFDQFSAELSSSLGTTERSGAFNNRVDGVLNVPLAGQLALRLIAGEEHLSGFIDDVGLAARQGPGSSAAPIPRVSGDPTSGFVIAPTLKGTNTSDQSYARAALRWDPTAGVDVELTYLHQKTSVDDCQCSNPNWPGGDQNLGSAYTGSIPPFADASYTVPAGGTYRNTMLVRQPYNNTVDLGSLVGSLDVGLATVTSATSFYDSRTDGTKDNTYQFYIPGATNFLPYYANYPRTIALEHDDTQDKAFVQELRLVSNGKHVLDYVVGVFFERQIGRAVMNQNMPGLQQYYSDVDVTSPNPQLGDLVVHIDQRSQFTDRAIFGELTWNITPNWQLTGGARFFSQSFDVDFAEVLPNCGFTCGDQFGGFDVFNSQRAKDHLVKLNTSYDLAKTTKVYATYSEGFRRGGATGLPPVGIYASLPTFFTYRPDVSKNYEMGIKGSAFDYRVQYTADVFVINLNDFQFNTYSPSGLPAVYNGSKARSKGAELELSAQLTTHLTASLGYSYTDATVSEPTTIYDLPPFGGPGSTPVLAVSLPAGTRLPAVPKSVLNAAVDYRMPLRSSAWAMRWHIDGNYRTSAPGAIPSTYLSAYTLDAAKTVNAMVTLENGKQWSFDLFGTNLTSDPGYSGAVGVQGVPLNSLNYRNVSRPRTIGVSAKYRFD